MSKEYLNASLAPEKRAKALLEEMSLEEKAAQLTGVFPFDEEYKDFDGISKRVPHGIGEVSTLEMRRMETLEEVAAWQKKVQEIVMENSEHHIPAIFHMEGLCGPFIQDSTSFPAGIGRGAGFDPEVEEKIAEIVSLAGSCLRNYPHISACSGYLQRFPYGTPGRNLWGRSGPCFCNGSCIYKRNTEKGNSRKKNRKCCQTFSGLP